MRRSEQPQSATPLRRGGRLRPATLWAMLLVAVAMVLLGGGLAAAVQSGNGSVSVKDIRFTGAGGKTLSALLYIPSGVTADNRAPAVLAVHGYINSRETQDAFAIELSRRGYVVLALDQSGHGFSGGAAFADGYGGPAALAYLHSLDVVDPGNIGLEGHSMGGWTVVSAAAAHPDFYRSMVLEGSSTGGDVAPEGTPTFPRNLKLVYGQHEEFSQLMWNSANPGEVQSSAKMQTLFGTDQPVVADRLYGSIQDGTARVVQRPWSTHPGLTVDPVAVADAVDWFGQTLAGGRPASGQVWWLKELGTLIAALGGMVFIVPFGGLLLRSRLFAGLAGRAGPGVGVRRGAPWWGTVALSAVISAATYFPFQVWGDDWVPADGVFPQTVTTGVMFWALGNALISLVLFAVWHATAGRRAGGSLLAYGLAGPRGFSWREVGRSLLLAVTVSGGLYGLLAFSNWAFVSDFRFYVFNLHLMDAARFRVFLTYLVPFTVFSLVIATVLHAQLRPAERDWTTGRRMAMNGFALAVGIFLLTVVNYVPLLAGGTLLVNSQPLLSIVAYQFVPLLFLVGLYTTFFADSTGTVYTGAFLSGILISWVNVASTANQVAVEPWGTGTTVVRVWLPVAAGLVLLLAAGLRRRSGDPAGDPVGSSPEQTTQEAPATGAPVSGRR